MSHIFEFHIFLFRNVYTALYLFVALFHALFHGMKEERECRIPSPFSMFIIFSTLSHSFASFLCFRKWTPAMQDSHSIQVFTSDWQWNKCASQKRDRLLCEVLTQFWAALQVWWWQKSSLKHDKMLMIFFPYTHHYSSVCLQRVR